MKFYEIWYKDGSKAVTFYRDEGMIVPAWDMPKAEDMVDPAMHDTGPCYA